MSKSNHEHSPARAQKRQPHTMPTTPPSVIRAIIAHIAQGTQPALPDPDSISEVAKLACAQWLAGLRAYQGLYVGQLVEHTGIRPEQLLALDLGLALPGMLAPQQEAALREAFLAGQGFDEPVVTHLLDLALGYERSPEPAMLTWVLDDLERNVWRRGDLESVFAEYFAPADTRELAEIGKELTQVQLLVLQILFPGPRSSQELHDEVVRRRVWGKAGFDSATFAAVVDFLVARGLVQLIEDRWDESLKRPLLHFRLTMLGMRVVALQRYTEQLPQGQTTIFTLARVWIAEQQGRANSVDTIPTG